jgi:hypothetical protein
MLRDTQTSTRMLACAGVRGEEDLHMLLSWRKRAFSLSLSLSLSLPLSCLSLLSLTRTLADTHSRTVTFQSVVKTRPTGLNLDRRKE